MQKVVDEFGEEERTLEDPAANWTPRRARRPGDELIDRVTLQRPPGGTAIQFSGSDALHAAMLMLDAWAQKTPKDSELSLVQFSIRFGDTLTFEGIANVHQRRSRDLAGRLRDPESFRAALCPTASPEEAAELFLLFVESYQIGITPARARKAVASKFEATREKR